MRHLMPDLIVALSLAVAGGGWVNEVPPGRLGDAHPATCEAVGQSHLTCKCHEGEAMVINKENRRLWCEPSSTS